MDHQFTFNDLEHSRKQLIIEKIDEAILKKAEKRLLEEISKDMKIKGFRPGKIPVEMVRQQIDPSLFQVQVLEKAAPDVANQLISDKDLRIIGKPDMKFESVDPLKIVIEFDVFPTVKLGDYQKITIKKKASKATDEEVEKAIESIQKKMTEYKAVERAAKKEDRVEIDFEGFDSKGKVLKNSKSQNHPVVIGSNMLIPGFEDKIIGMKKDEEKSFSITFPKDYHAKELAGKEARFQVKLLKIEESYLPEIDKAFIEKVSGKKQSLDDWKKMIKEQIQEEHDRTHRRDVEEAYFEQLIAITTIDTPLSLIEEEKKTILNEIKQQILQRGLSYDRYLQSSGKTEEELLKSYDKQARDRISLRLSLQEISQKEGITATESETQEKLDKMLNAYPEKRRQELKKLYRPGTDALRSLEYQIKMEKTLEKVIPKV